MVRVFEISGKCCLLLFGMTLWVTLADAQPRQINPAEEAAVRLVLAHLTTGPSALWDATSASSRIRKLGAEEGTQEIELRTGPGAGSEWELITTTPAAGSVAGFHVTFPSGVDDTVVFAMALENGAWRISDIRSMSDAVTPVASLPSPPATPVVEKVVEKTTVPRTFLLVLGAAALLCGVAAFAVRRRWRRLSYLLGGSAALALLSFAGVFYLRPLFARATPAATAPVRAISPEKSRAALLDLRRRAATGEPIDNDAFRGLDEASADRAALWGAQLHLQRNDLAAAARSLDTVKKKNDTPLAQVLAGRMAFLQNRDVDAVLAYERAMELGSQHDDLLYEAASVLMTLGFRDRAERYFRLLAELGSREADIYYSLAMLEALKNSEEVAEKSLLTAYRYRPELRSELVKAGVFYSLLRRPAVRQQFVLHQSEEPLVRPARLAERPLDIPLGTSARCLGEHLEIDLLGCKLQIPGGAFMAPTGTPALDAGAWDRGEASAAVRRAPTLAGVAAQASTYAQPALARRINATASALAARNRWSEVVTLTEGINASFDLVPAELLLMKAQAQTRTGQPDAARTFLREIVTRPALLERLDGRQLLQAGEILASLESYDLAIRLMERAGRLRELPHIDDRIRQLTMNQRLAKFSAYQTPHFVIRYSEETGIAGAQNIARIAEAELVRLQRWIPGGTFKPVVINVLSWETFRGVYTGSDHILGFYNGQITIPFADVGSYPPEIVAILSHELAHAMIAQRTGDQAPRWFQEGLAQRIESVPFRRNPFNMYDPEQLLAFRLLDDFVTYSPDPAVIAQSYLVSHALIRYIEGRWGQAGLTRLLDAFAAGSTTEEAIELLSGGSLPAFDRAFAEWGLSRREVFENTDLVSYERNEVEMGIRRRPK